MQGIVVAAATGGALAVLLLLAGVFLWAGVTRNFKPLAPQLDESYARACRRIGCGTLAAGVVLLTTLTVSVPLIGSRLVLWPTRTPYPTYTPWPTYTPRPTPTSLPTRPMLHTSTPYPTNTPWPTYTPPPIHESQPAEAPSPVLVLTDTPALESPPKACALPEGYELFDDFLDEGDLGPHWYTYTWAVAEDVCVPRQEGGHLGLSCAEGAGDERLLILHAQDTADQLATGIAVCAQVTKATWTSRLYLSVATVDAQGARDRIYDVSVFTHSLRIDVAYPGREGAPSEELATVDVGHVRTHLLQIELEEGGMRFLADGQAIPLETKVEVPAGSSWGLWTLEAYARDEVGMSAVVDWVAIRQ